MVRPPRETTIAPAVVKTIRETTSVSLATMAQLCGTTVRSMVNWESGRFPAPADAAATIIAVAATWTDEMRRLTEIVDADPAHVVVTYRGESELATARIVEPNDPAHQGIPSAAWHRSVVGHVAIERPGLEVVWWRDSGKDSGCRYPC